MLRRLLLLLLGEALPCMVLCASALGASEWNRVVMMIGSKAGR